MNDFIVNDSFKTNTIESIYVNTRVKNSQSDVDSTDVSMIVGDSSNSKIVLKEEMTTEHEELSPKQILKKQKENQIQSLGEVRYFKGYKKWDCLLLYPKIKYLPVNKAVEIAIYLPEAYSVRVDQGDKYGIVDLHKLEDFFSESTGIILNKNLLL